MQEVLGYAKINLTLEVMNTDERNYHLVNTLMVPIDIYDVIRVEKSDRVYIENDFVENNIALKAAKLFIEHFKIDGGVKITIEKNIPMAAGLAGGSTDAAAVLKAMNLLYDVKASDSELEYLCSKLGSDVAFFIKSRLAMCTHYGEVVEPIDIDVPNIPVVLIKIKEGLSTKVVYDNYEYVPVDRSKNVEGIYEALRNGDVKLLEENVFNDLNKVSLELSEKLRELHKKLSEKYTTFISGSGPTMFIFGVDDQDVLEIKNMVDSETFVYKTRLI